MKITRADSRHIVSTLKKQLRASISYLEDRPSHHIKPHDRYAVELGGDSFDAYMLIYNLEEALRISIPDKGALDMLDSTVLDMYLNIRKKLHPGAVR